MRDWSIVAATVLAGIAGAANASAQGNHGTEAKLAARALGPSLSAKPYSRLFGQQPAPVRPPFRLMPPQPPVRGTTPLPTCGLVVVPADPTIDPKFERRPADDGTRFSMRTMPWLCK